MEYYLDYIWRNGIPQGSIQTNSLADTSYKIVTDPYRKRISIEKYRIGEFSEVVYDSSLLDFRSIKHPDQTAWQRISASGKEERARCIIKNQEDRVLFIEEYKIHKGYCLECIVFSAHGFLLSKHKMLYENLGDPFSGVTLYDRNDHLVMYKRYMLDSKTLEFGELLEECWDPVDLHKKQD